MKKKNRTSKPIPILVIPAVLLIAGVTFLLFSLNREQIDTETALTRIRALEDTDPRALQEQIDALTGGAGSQAGGETASATVSDIQQSIINGHVLDDVQIRQAFAGTVIIGDSITESIVEYGFLDTDVVISKRGLSIIGADEQIETAIGLNPHVVFLAFGSNDLELYEGDVDTFQANYRSQVKKICAGLPDVPIYINLILPIQQSAIDAVPALGYYGEFNEALKELCSEEGWSYIDNSFIVENDPTLYEPDGEHVVVSYYPKWLTYMAETAGLA